MYYCKSCRDSFDEPIRRADYDERNTRYLFSVTGEQHVCPCCGSRDYIWVENHCYSCGQYLPDDKLHDVEESELMLCDSCIDKLVKQDADRQEERDA